MMGNPRSLFPPLNWPWEWWLKKPQISKPWWGFGCASQLQGLGCGRWQCQGSSQGCSLTSDVFAFLQPFFPFPWVYGSLLPPRTLPKKLDLEEKGECVSLQEYRWDLFHLKGIRNPEVGVDKGEERSEKDGQARWMMVGRVVKTGISNIQHNWAYAVAIWTASCPQSFQSFCEVLKIKRPNVGEVFLNLKGLSSTFESRYCRRMCGMVRSVHELN